MNGVVRRQITWEIVTPMFAGGATSDDLGIRASSFKGLLRWWWRATSSITDVKQLHRLEGELFGQVHGDTQIKSPISIAVIHAGSSVEKDFAGKTGNSRGENMGTSDRGKPIQVDGKKFLSYGAWKLGEGGADRPALAPDQTFTLKLKYPKEFEAEYDRAFMALHLYGGLGMKSRNGFGQIQIVQDTVRSPTGEQTPYKIKISSVDTGSLSKRKFSTLGDEIVLSGKPYFSWDDAMYDLGILYYRAKNALATNEKNVFAGHNPKQLGLERKASSAQLFVRKVEGGYRYGMVALPYELAEGSIGPGEHNRVTAKFTKSFSTLIKEYV